MCRTSVPVRSPIALTGANAIQHTDAIGQGVAISVRGRPMVVDPNDAHRLEAAGVEFAYFYDHQMLDGSNGIVTVPVN